MLTTIFVCGFIIFVVVIAVYYNRQLVSGYWDGRVGNKRNLTLNEPIKGVLKWTGFFVEDPSDGEGRFVAIQWHDREEIKNGSKIRIWLSMTSICAFTGPGDDDYRTYFVLERFIVLKKHA